MGTEGKWDKGEGGGKNYQSTALKLVPKRKS